MNNKVQAGKIAKPQSVQIVASADQIATARAVIAADQESPRLLRIGASNIRTLSTPVSPDAEVGLFHLMRTGTQADRRNSRNALLIHNERLVPAAMSSLRLTAHLREELMSEGIALLLARIENFVPTGQAPFAAYAMRGLLSELIAHMNCTAPAAVDSWDDESTYAQAVSAEITPEEHILASEASDTLRTVMAALPPVVVAMTMTRHEKPVTRNGDQVRYKGEVVAQVGSWPAVAKIGGTSPYLAREAVVQAERYIASQYEEYRNAA